MLIEIPPAWPNPAFTLGQTVYATSGHGEPLTVVGMAYQAFSSSWAYDVSDRPDIASASASIETYDEYTLSAAAPVVEGDEE